MRARTQYGLHSLAFVLAFSLLLLAGMHQDARQEHGAQISAAAFYVMSGMLSVAAIVAGLRYHTTRRHAR